MLLATGPAGPGASVPVAEWARATGAQVQQVPASLDTMEAELQHALDGSPTLIVAVGAEIIDLIGFQSPQYLEQPFLLIGGQLAEPTANVTAVIWPGADFRGAGGDTSAVDPASFTPERINRALDAGTRLVLDGSDGAVLELP